MIILIRPEELDLNKKKYSTKYGGGK